MEPSPGDPVLDAQSQDQNVVTETNRPSVGPKCSQTPAPAVVPELGQPRERDPALSQRAGESGVADVKGGQQDQPLVRRWLLDQ